MWGKLKERFSKWWDPTKVPAPNIGDVWFKGADAGWELERDDSAKVVVVNQNNITRTSMIALVQSDGTIGRSSAPIPNWLLWQNYSFTGDSFPEEFIRTHEHAGKW